MGFGIISCRRIRSNSEFQGCSLRCFRFLQTGLIFAVLTASPNAFSQQADEAVTEAVVRAWRKRQADARTIDVCWTGRDTFAAKSHVITRNGERHLEPETTQTHWSAGRCVWDVKEERLRTESNRMLLTLGRRMSRHISLHTYDGIAFKTYYLQSHLTSLGRRPNIYTWESKAFSDALSNIQCLPLRLVYGGLDRIDNLYQVSEPIFSTAGEEKVGERTCQHLQLTPKKVRMRRPGQKGQVWRPVEGVEEHFWLDEERNFLPVSFTRTRRQRAGNDSKNDLSVQVDISYEDSEGRFIPKSWTISYQFKDGVPTRISTADVTRLTTNDAVPLSQFRFEGYPQGMYIVDAQSTSPAEEQGQE